MSSGFEKTIILEANRRSSEEFKSGNLTNPALWTNKVNDGLKIKKGDVISVNSAYISELGAEGSEIEIKGVSINASKRITITETTHTTNTSYTGSNNLFGFDTRLINQHLINSLVDKQVDIEHRDDSINFVVSPYKNANGEFYTSLPWNYAITTDRNTAKNALAWEDPMTSVERVMTNGTGVFGDAATGNTTMLPRDKTWSRVDRRKFFPGIHGHVGSGSATTAIRNDNSRYAIYQIPDVIHTYGLASDDQTTSRTEALKGIKWGEDEDGYSISISNVSYTLGDRQSKPINTLYRDIAFQPYKRIKTLISASANVGYNSPSDVASKITEDLLRTVDIKKKVITNTTAGQPGSNKDTTISTFAENQVNKLYKCAGPESYSWKNAYHFMNWANDGDKDITQIYQYITAYESIGVKRPDLFDLGREFPPTGYVLQSAYQRDSTDKLLQTSIPWTEDNLKMVSNLIEAQQRYPELLDSENMNGENFSDLRGQSNDVFSAEDNIWFLHLNMSASNTQTLGYDLMDSRASYWQTNSSVGGNQADLQPSASMATAPIFLSFNSKTRNLNKEHISGSDFDNAVYGFAIKHTTADSEEFISVKVFGVYKTEDKSRVYQVNPQPVQLDNIPVLTRIGWDYHFSAYGCPCMLLYNGMSGLDNVGFQQAGIGIMPEEEVKVDSQKSITLGDKVPEIYLGSPNISLAFSQDTDRFEWRNFHTSEVIGNLYNAGYKAEELYTDVNASGVVTFTNPDATAIPVNPDSAQKVYKINKSLLKNNWSPLMVSYNNQIDNASFYTRYTSTLNGCYTAKQSFPFLNPAFPTNTIFDSTCGLFVTDWIVEEKDWNNSLWGIMGFQYSQTTGKSSNQTRVINSNNWSAMLENTTNADITNQDFDKLTRNMFGAPNYNLTPPIQETPFFQPLGGNASHRFLPNITVTQDTGQPLRALNLPTRTLRPYYTIRSNIINTANSYFGGSGTGVPLPVVAVVDKVSNSGDFFNIDSSNLTFTATQDYVISDIRTSVCDPDGSFAKLSDNTAVLYKIQKQIQADTNVVESILQEFKTQKQKILFEESLDPPEPTKEDIKDIVALLLNK